MDQVVAQLQEALRSGAAVVVTGAGVSVAVSGGEALAWDGLLSAGIEWCAERVPGLPDGWVAAVERVLALGDISSMLAVAQMITDKMGGRKKAEYRQFLNEQFHDLQVVDDRVPRAIAALGVPIVTTNYDGLIEKALGWDRATWMDSARLQQILRQRDNVVAHLHGHWVEPESVVLGIRSYDELLHHPGAQGLTRALTAMRTLVLIGMGEGTKDPNWSALRDWMKETISDTTFPAFRLCRRLELDQLCDEHRDEPIKPVVYGDHFEDLPGFLESLAPDAAQPQMSAPATAPGSPAKSARARSSEVVITVDQSGRDGYKSIAEALQAAPSGARLNVRPGEYLEELVVDKVVTIAGLGDAPGDVKVIGQYGHTVQWTAAIGGLRNIALRQLPGESWYCLDIVSGRLDMDHCDVKSEALACVAIHRGADPLIRNTDIHDGNDVGIHVLPGGRGTIVDCQVREFRLDGVRVDGGSPAIRRTTIADAGQYGLYVMNSGAGIYEDNTISHCKFANVAVSSEADPQFRQNKCTTVVSRA